MKRALYLYIKTLIETLKNKWFVNRKQVIINYTED